jgi:hypothetical protein
MNIPKTYEELKSAGRAELSELWLQFMGKPLTAPNPALRPMWYRIQCKNQGLRLEQAVITRLNRYAANPDECVDKSHKTKYVLKSGSNIVKTYKGKLHTIRILAQDKFEYADYTYGSLSAVAREITGKKLSGFDFFGLNNKDSNELTSAAQ